MKSKVFMWVLTAAFLNLPMAWACSTCTSPGTCGSDQHGGSICYINSAESCCPAGTQGVSSSASACTINGMGCTITVRCCRISKAAISTQIDPICSESLVERSE